MNEIEVTKQHMEALNALAQTNLDISAAKEILSKMQEEETEYLISREKKAIDRLKKVMQDSKDLVDETNKNYEFITNFVRTVHDSTTFLAEALAVFTSVTQLFHNKQEAWEIDCKEQEETINNIRNGIKISQEKLENDQKALAMRMQEMENIRRKLEDERGTLARAVERLKQGKI